MIGTYIAGALAVTCYVGALRQWPVPLAGDRPQDPHVSLSPPPPSATRGSAVRVEPPPPAQLPSAPDLAGLGDQQIQVLHASIGVLQDLLVGLAALDRVPRPSVEHAEVSAQTQELVGRANAQLLTLAQQVRDSSWPHREWALSFDAAERKAKQHIDTWQQPDSKKLAGCLTDLLQLIASRYPSMFRHQV